MIGEDTVRGINSSGGQAILWIRESDKGEGQTVWYADSRGGQIVGKGRQ